MSGIHLLIGTIFSVCSVLKLYNISSLYPLWCACAGRNTHSAKIVVKQLQFERMN